MSAARQLIDRSVATDSIIHATWSPELETDLLAESLGHVSTGGELLEVWGTTENGWTWRVHLEVVR